MFSAQTASKLERVGVFSPLEANINSDVELRAAALNLQNPLVPDRLRRTLRLRALI